MKLNLGCGNKIFDGYDPQNFWQTLEAGAKK